MKNFISLIAVALLLTACASSPSKTGTAQSSATQQTSASETPGGTVTQAEVDARKLAEQVKQLNSQSVYFDFDNSEIKPEYQNVISDQAAFVKSHSADELTLTGNCDERGSSEYNIALGGKRAYVVSRALQLMGVPATQIKTVSYGEERPRLTCHEERCWKENRRVDFHHTAN